MTKTRSRSEYFYREATAYHEAGHAVVALLLGRRLFLIEVTSHLTGVVFREKDGDRLAQLVDLANQRHRVPAELLRLWMEEYWISDAGAIAEVEFNLIPDDLLANRSWGDQMNKVALIPDEEQYAYVHDYFHRHILPWSYLITEGCRRFIRLPRISAMTRTLAEVLLRTPRIEGGEVIDLLLANRAALTGQIDLFWIPVGDDPFVRRRAALPPKQLRLF